MIKAGYPVFFGCDVGKFSDKTAGIMDTALFEYEVRYFFLPMSKHTDEKDRMLSILSWALQRQNVYKLMNHP